MSASITASGPSYGSYARTSTLPTHNNSTSTNANGRTTPSNTETDNKYHGHARSNSIQRAIASVRRRSGSTAEVAEKLKVPVSWELVGMCLVWYLSSALTNTSSKSILNAFLQPVTLTLIQFGFVAGWCIALSTASQLSPTLRKLVPGIKNGLRLPSWEIFHATAPLACFQVGGHITSSFATSRIPVSLVHTIKGLSPLFTVLAYKVFYEVKYSRETYISLIPLTVGVMLACSFELRGEFLGVVSAFIGALIFVTQNIVSKKIFNDSQRAGDDAIGRLKKPDKLNLLCYSSATAFVLTLPLWLYYEGGRLIGDYWNDGTIKIIGKHAKVDSLSGQALLFEFVFNGTSHFGQNIIAFILLSRVSPVTYSVASLVKRIFVIVMAIIWFGNSTTNVQAFGIFLTFVGLYMYDRAGDVSRKERSTLQSKDLLPLSLDTKPKDRHLGPTCKLQSILENTMMTTSPLPKSNGHALSPMAGEPSEGAWLPGTKQEETWRPSEVMGGGPPLGKGIVT